MNAKNIAVPAQNAPTTMWMVLSMTISKSIVPPFVLRAVRRGSGRILAGDTAIS